MPDKFRSPQPGGLRDDARLRLVEQAADGLYIVDGDGRFEFVNSAAVELFGYGDQSELVGRDSHAAVHYKHPDGSAFPVEECPLLEVRRTGRTVHVDDDSFVRRDGTLVPVAYSSAPFATHRGAGAVVVIRDMTALRRAEAELQLLQTATLLMTSAEELAHGVSGCPRPRGLRAGVEALAPRRLGRSTSTYPSPPWPRSKRPPSSSSLRPSPTSRSTHARTGSR